MALATCYAPYELPTQQPSTRTVVQVPIQKDYTRPLHVDCSVEYELPNQAKPPQGVRNEPLLMIHPCYFRKIESQRRSPFINNLPTAAAATTRQATPTTTTTASKRRVARTHHQYPTQYTTAIIDRYPQSHHPQQQQWEMPHPLVPISATATAVQQQQPQQSCCKRDALCGVGVIGGAYNNSAGSVDSGHWTDPDRSPDRPEDKHILTGKYRQYLRAHRLHPYVSSAAAAIPIASAFPQIHQQVCYNV